MTSGDIAFILLFIVLPTAIIVSGFWVILFVVRRPAGNAILDSSTSQRDDSPLATETDEASNMASEGDSPALDFTPAQSPPPAEDDEPALEELGPVAADLLADEMIAVASDTASADLDDQDPAEVSQTEEIPEMGDPFLVSQDDAEEPSSDDEAPEPAANVVQFGSWHRGASQSEEESSSQATSKIDAAASDADQTIELSDLTTSANSPTLDPLDGESDEVAEASVPATRIDDAPDSDDRDTENGQPKRTLLVPSHASERKNRRNARTAGRQVPRISRSAHRDEPVVKGSDGSADV